MSLPTFAAVLMAPSEGRGRNMAESFDFGLDRVLDGIEHYLEKPAGAATVTLKRP